MDSREVNKNERLELMKALYRLKGAYGIPATGPFLELERMIAGTNKYQPVVIDAEWTVKEVAV